MSRKLKLSLIYFLFILLAGHAFAEVNLTHLVENIRPAVVTVITYDKDKKPLSQGSGFFIDANGHLVTNYHVLEGADHAEVKTYSGRKYPIKSVIGENKNMDLIKVLADISRSSVQWINVTGTLPSLAERVVVVGSPMGLEQTVSEGIVSGVRAIPGLGEILQISAAISSGSSGSPVVNMKGQVVGIVSFYLMKGQSLNFAVPGQYLIDLKPSKTIKTISEWTYGVNKKSLRKTPQQGRLFVYIEPEGARVRIINIKPKFYQGIVLKSGSYHIEVSADGYEMEKMWIKIRPGETKNLRISLKNLPHLSIKNPDELVSMGIVYKNKGEYKKAIDTFKQAIRIDPNNSIAHYNLGIIYLHSDRQREAIEALKQTIRIDPYLARAYSGLGVSYGSLGLYRESIDAYKQYLIGSWGSATANLIFTERLLRHSNRPSELILMWHSHITLWEELIILLVFTEKPLRLLSKPPELIRIMHPPTIAWDIATADLVFTEKPLRPASRLSELIRIMHPPTIA
jgi:hypothetical protein